MRLRSYGGYVLGYVGGDLDDSAACIDRALFLNPNLAAALGVSSWVKACLGEPDKAVEHAAPVHAPEPFGPAPVCLAVQHRAGSFLRRTLRRCRRLGGKIVTPPAELSGAMRVMAAGQVMSGRSAEAEGTIARLCQLDPALRLSNLADILPPFRRSDDRNRYIEALRMAGLPE